jgi:hypothetical protein
MNLPLSGVREAPSKSAALQGFGSNERSETGADNTAQLQSYRENIMTFIFLSLFQTRHIVRRAPVHINTYSAPPTYGSRFFVSHTCRKLIGSLRRPTRQAGAGSGHLSRRSTRRSSSNQQSPCVLGSWRPRLRLSRRYLGSWIHSTCCLLRCGICYNPSSFKHRNQKPKTATINLVQNPGCVTVRNRLFPAPNPKPLALDPKP